MDKHHATASEKKHDENHTKKEEKHPGQQEPVTPPVPAPGPGDRPPLFPEGPEPPK